VSAMKLVMTLLVRDEEDILRAHIDYHLNQGVDKIIVMDNMSVDRTPDIIADYVQTGAVHYIYQGRDDYSQGSWVTGMALTAFYQFGADWVINSDADEFWWTDGRSLKDVLAREPGSASAVRVERQNFIPRPENGEPFWQRMTVRETRSLNAIGEPIPPKVIHRGEGNIRVEQGNHRILRGGAPIYAAPCSLSILHFPVRSEAQLTNKIVKGGAAYARNPALPEHFGSAWRYLYDLYQKGQLSAHYRETLLSDDAMAQGLRKGELVRDDRLKKRLETFYGNG
jgi:hypothetical protein